VPIAVTGCVRTILIAALVAGCVSEVPRTQAQPGRVVVLYVTHEAGRAEGYHDDYVVLEQRLLTDMARDPRIIVHVRPDDATACAEVESGAADYIASLDVEPKTTVPRHFWGQFCKGDVFSKGHGCVPYSDSSTDISASVTVALTIAKPVLNHGRPQHFCTAFAKLSHKWSSPTVDGDGWQPLVGDQLARAGVWIDAHVDSHYFGVSG